MIQNVKIKVSNLPKINKNRWKTSYTMEGEENHVTIFIPLMFGPGQASNFLWDEPVPSWISTYGSVKFVWMSLDRSTRSVASIFAHAPVRAAEIWKKYIFCFLKAFLSLNGDDINFSHYIGVFTHLKVRRLALCCNLLNGVTLLHFFKP